MVLLLTILLYNGLLIQGHAFEANNIDLKESRNFGRDGLMWLFLEGTKMGIDVKMNA